MQIITLSRPFGQTVVSASSRPWMTMVEETSPQFGDYRRVAARASVGEIPSFYIAMSLAAERGGAISISQR